MLKKPIIRSASFPVCIFTIHDTLKVYFRIHCKYQLSFMSGFSITDTRRCYGRWEHFGWFISRFWRWAATGAQLIFRRKKETETNHNEANTETKMTTISFFSLCEEWKNEQDCWWM